MRASAIVVPDPRFQDDEQMGFGQWDQPDQTFPAVAPDCMGHGVPPLQGSVSRPLSANAPEPVHTPRLRVLSANNRMSQETLFIAESVSPQALTRILKAQEGSGEHVTGGADGTRIRLRRVRGQ
jgi:hypothetical protein